MMYNRTTRTAARKRANINTYMLPVLPQERDYLNKQTLHSVVVFPPRGSRCDSVVNSHAKLP